MNLEDIHKEIDQWITEYLDVPSEFYNGLKPCPFALKAWKNDKVKIVIGDANTVEEEIESWDSSYDLVAIAYDPDLWTDEEASDWCEERNKTLASQDLYLFDSASEDEVDDPDYDMDHLPCHVDYPYGLVMLQSLSEVNKFAGMLDKQGYYENCSKKFMDYVNKRKVAQHGRRK